ncbi:MAG: Asp-tRNA(Asn)/Glu-tRNA(Gln) amidotransferase subunit GatA [Leptospirillia bacterium]
MKNPFFNSVADFARGRDEGRFTLEEVTAYFLDRTRSLSEEIHACLSVNDNAINRARQLDNRLRREKAPSPLTGYPLMVKDNLEVRDQSTTCASRILEGYRSLRTATAVSRLLSLGTIVLGKTNLDEFAMGSSTENSAFGPTRNPWDPSRVPGGSSGGSAAAVAAGLAPLALGSDTGGSIRQPAAFCGVIGIKPTYGRISRSGLVAFASSLDQIGPFAVEAEDALEALVAMAGADPLDMTTEGRDPEEMRRDFSQASLSGMRLGIPAAFFGEGLDSSIRERLGEVRKGLSFDGVLEKEIELAHAAMGINVYYVLATSEAASNLCRFDGVRYGFRTGASGSLREMYEETRDKGFGLEVKRRILLGTFALSAGYQEAFYRKARKVQALIRQEFLDAFSRCDIIMTPTSPTPAFSFGEKTGDPLSMYLSDIYTITANLAGLPALSVPAGVDAKGLPVGVHLIGPPWSEGRLLAVAREISRRWPMPLPRVHAMHPIAPGPKKGGEK